MQTGTIEGTDRESVRRWTEVAKKSACRPNVIDSIRPFRRTSHRARPAFESLWTILHFLGRRLAARWIVEGAGGALVPLNERDLMPDLMRQIGFPVIVAARTSLGTINHTLLTLGALRQARLPICGVVLIGEENIENRRAIEHYGQVPVIGHIPMLQEINRASLLKAYEKHFDHRAFE